MVWTGFKVWIGCEHDQDARPSLSLREVDLAGMEPDVFRPNRQSAMRVKPRCPRAQSRESSLPML